MPAIRILGDEQNMRVQPEVQIGRRHEFMILDKPKMDIGIMRFQYDEHRQLGEEGRQKIRNIGIFRLRCIFPGLTR